MLIKVKKIEIDTDKILSIALRANRKAGNVELVICLSDSDEQLIINFDSFNETNEFFDQLK